MRRRMKAIISGVSHSAGPTSRPISRPARSISSVVGRPTAPSSLRLAAAVDVHGEVLDADLAVELAHDVQSLPVDRQGDDLEVRTAERALQPVEGRHFLAAGHAPCRPHIEQHALAAEIREDSVAAVAVHEPDVGQRLGRIDEYEASLLRGRRQCGQHQQHGEDRPHGDPRPAPRRRRSINGMIVVSRICSVRGPTCLCMARPSALTT